METTEVKERSGVLQKTITTNEHLIFVCSDVQAHLTKYQHHKHFTARLHADTDLFSLFSHTSSYDSGGLRVVLYSKVPNEDGATFRRGVEIMNSNLTALADTWFSILETKLLSYIKSYQTNIDSAKVALTLLDSLVVDNLAINKHLDRLRLKYAPFRHIADSNFSFSFPLLLKSGNIFID